MNRKFQKTLFRGNSTIKTEKIEVDLAGKFAENLEFRVKNELSGQF